jgi:hypothetical protein
MPADRRGKQRSSRWKRKRIPGYTPEADTADELNVSTRTLRKWRQLRVGPPWVEIGRQIHYPDENRAQWIKSRVVHPVAQRETHMPHDAGEAA